MEATIKVSLILVSYNSRIHLERCLPGLSASLPPDAEIILVDNGSQDGSSDYVQKMHTRVLLIRSLTNLGYGKANNLGASLARGRFLVFLNPDTLIDPACTDALVAALQAHPQAGLAAPRILLLPYPEKINACGNDVHMSGLALCRGMGQPCDKFLSIKEVGAVSGAAFAIRRDLFQRLRGFDETFFLYMEDTDLSWRARLAGYTVLYVPAAVVYHDYRLAFSPHKLYCLERNRYRMLLKCLRWNTLLALLPALLLAEIVAWGFVLLCPLALWRSKLRAYVALSRDWKDTLRARGLAQAQRRISDRELLQTCTASLDFRQLGTGLPARLASSLFNPLFKILYRLVLNVL